MKLIRTIILAVLAVALSLVILFPAGSIGAARESTASTAATVAGAMIPRAYLPTIIRSPDVDMFISRVEVVQGTTLSSAYRVHVAGRATTLRIFVGLTGKTSQSGVVARLTRYKNGIAQSSPLISSAVTIYSPTNEGVILQTINFALPSLWLEVGTAYTIELDPYNAIAEGSEANNRYPASGSQSFNFQAADPMSVVLVPIDYVPPSRGGQHFLPDTSRTDYLSWLPIKVFPVATINYVWRTPYTWRYEVSPNGDGWSSLLNAVTALHNQEDPGGTKLYYGVINTFDAHGCDNGCVVGIGWLRAPTAVGFSGWGSGTDAAGDTMTHEMGHNFGRSHVLCQGNEASPDYAYPYSGGLIGTWGIDSLSNPLTLYDPHSYADYMSYCNSTWTSDYTYKSIFDYRATSPYDLASTTTKTNTLYLGGSFSEDGDVDILPFYRQDGFPDDTSQGTHKLQLFDGAGKLLGEYHFTPLEIPDAPVRTWGFHLTLPYVDGIAVMKVLSEDGSILYERRAQADTLSSMPELSLQSTRLQATPQPDGSLLATWDAVPAPSVVYRIRFSRDGGETWEVLSLSHPEPSYTVPAGLLSGAPDPILEVQAVDGLRTFTQTLKLQRD